MNERTKRKVHLRLWTGVGDYGFGHPRRNGGVSRPDNTDRPVRTMDTRTKSALRRMASIAHSRITMDPAERVRRALAFAAPLTRRERNEAMRRLFGQWPFTLEGVRP